MVLGCEMCPTLFFKTILPNFKITNIQTESPMNYTSILLFLFPWLFFQIPSPPLWPLRFSYQDRSGGWRREFTSNSLGDGYSGTATQQALKHRKMTSDDSCHPYWGDQTWCTSMIMLRDLSSIVHCFGWSHIMTPQKNRSPASTSLPFMVIQPVLFRKMLSHWPSTQGR